MGQSCVHSQLWAAWLCSDWQTPSACPHSNHSSACCGPFSKSLLAPARVAWVFLMPPTVAGCLYFHSANSPFKSPKHPSIGYAREKKKKAAGTPTCAPAPLWIAWGASSFPLVLGLLTFWALTFSILLFQHVLAAQRVS